MPSTAEMAELVFILKKGAMTGLARLGMIAEEKPAKKDVIAAFTRLSEYLTKELTNQEQAHMIYNILMLEHALCKYTRLVPDSRGRRGSGQKKGS